MKKLLLAIAAAFFALASPAAAQQQTVKLCVQTSGTACAPVTATAPLPVTAGGGGGSFPVTIADGADVAQGATTDATCGSPTGTCTLVALVKYQNAAYVAGSGSVSGGTAATSSALIGGVYNTVKPTLTNGQQAAVQFDTAGNLLIGQGGNIYVGTYALNTFVQPTVTASSAYASGNVVGGLMTFTGAARSAGATGMLTSVTIDFQDAQTGAWDLLLFDQNPTNSTFTDKTAVAVAAADINKLIKVVHISDCTSTGSTSSCQADGIGKNYSTVSNTSLYGVLVTRGTPTFGATNDLMVRLFGQEN